MMWQHAPGGKRRERSENGAGRAGRRHPNGTQAEQQASAAEMEQDRLARDQAQHDLDALTKLAATGAASPGEVTAARERLETAQASLNAAQQSAHIATRRRDCPRQASLNDAQAALASHSISKRKPRTTHR